MIYLVTGKPRSGKGLYVMRQVAVDALLNSNDTIVGNFPFKLAELHQWIQREHPGRIVDVFSRVKMLEAEQVKEFFLHRGGVGRPRYCSEDMRDRGVILDFGEVLEPEPDDPTEMRFKEGNTSVTYILDEVDMCFSARDWAKNGKGFNYYNKQHGKFGDSVYYVCQDAMQIDSLIRAVVQRTVVMTNWGKITYKGFRLSNKIKWKIYEGVPAGRRDTVMETGSFTMESLRGLQECYSTAAGHGMRGVKKADRNDRVKGWSIWWLAPVPVLLLLCVLNLSKIGGWLSGKASGAARQVKTENTKTNSVGRSIMDMARAVTGEKSAPIAKVTQRNHEPEPVVYMTGYMQRYGDWRVFLSDGSVYSTAQKDVEFIARDHCIIRGKVYRIGPGPAPEVDVRGARPGSMVATKEEPVIVDMPEMTTPMVVPKFF